MIKWWWESSIYRVDWYFNDFKFGIFTFIAAPMQFRSQTHSTSLFRVGYNSNFWGHNRRIQVTHHRCGSVEISGQMLKISIFSKMFVKLCYIFMSKITFCPVRFLYRIHKSVPGRWYSIIYSDGNSFPVPLPYRPCVSTPVIRCVPFSEIWNFIIPVKIILCIIRR